MSSLPLPVRFDTSGLFLAMGGTGARALGVKQDWASLYDVGGALGGKVRVSVQQNPITRKPQNLDRESAIATVTRAAHGAAALECATVLEQQQQGVLPPAAGCLSERSGWAPWRAPAWVSIALGSEEGLAHGMCLQQCEPSVCRCRQVFFSCDGVQWHRICTGTPGLVPSKGSCCHCAAVLA